MGKATARKRGTKTEQLAEARLQQLLFLQSMERDESFLETARREVPEAWHNLEMDIETTAPKEKVTLYLDKSVAAVFRKMGGGYQARINRILETWVQMKMANLEAFRKDVVERVSEASEAARGAGGVAEEVRAKLIEHWAYQEGLRDGKAG